MSSVIGVRRTLDDVRRLSSGQRRLTAVIAVAPALAWGCSLTTGSGVSLWTLMVVVAASLLTVIHPDSHAGLFTVLFLGWYWLTRVSTQAGDPVPLGALGAGLFILAFHTATAARATAPGPAGLDQAFWRRWLGRTAVVAAATGGAWGLTAVMASQHSVRDGLTVTAFAVVAGGIAYARWAVVRGQ